LQHTRRSGFANTSISRKADPLREKLSSLISLIFAPYLTVGGTVLKNKLLTYAPFVLGTLVIIYLQMMLLTAQQIKPFPESYGRETKLDIDATDAIAPQTVGPHEFGYLSGESLTYVSLDDSGKSSIVQRPLPSSDLTGGRPYRFFGDQIFWVGSDQRLYTSHWQEGKWTAKLKLNDMETNAFDVLTRKEGYFIVWSDPGSVYAGKVDLGKQTAWTSYPFAKVTKLQAASDERGNLSAAVVSVQGDTSDFYILRFSEVLQLEQQALVKHLTLPGFNKFDDMAYGLTKSTAYVFYTVSSTKSGKSFLTKLSMPVGNLSSISEERVNVLSMLGNESDTNLHPYLIPGSNDQLLAVITAFYEKDRRFAHQEPYILTYKAGVKTGEQRLSGYRGFAEHPMLFINEKGNGQAVWLNRKDAGKFEVLYTTDQPGYAQRMNVFTQEDQAASLKNLPLFWGIGLLTVLISVKWLALPFLYLLIMISIRENELVSHTNRHMAILIGMYALVKVLTIGDYKKPIALEMMPEFMQQGYFAYLILVLVLLLSYGWMVVWRRRLDERSPLKEFTYLSVIDIYFTTLWYSYFLSPAHL
jgi:hypothetical protein